MLSIRKNSWKNWSESFMNTPEAILYPKSIEAIVQVVKQCQQTRKNIRVIGAGHSFTPLAVSEGVLLSLKYISGIEKIDHETNRVTIWAGTTLTELGNLLHAHGLAMENLGDINVQTIAGAISTGTHGSGKDYGSLSTQVTKITMITPDGEVITTSHKENNHLFQATRLSLGLLGIIIKVEIQATKAHRLISESRLSSMVEVLPNVSAIADANRHFEFFWFPYTEAIQLKTLNKPAKDTIPDLKGGNTFDDIVMENGALWLLSEISRKQPGLSKWISKMISRGVPTGKKIGSSFEMYATPRLVKFNEMEYSIPAEHMASALQDINYVIQKNNITIHFPLECRYVKKDDIWLSPSYKRDSAYIAIHMYKGMEYKSCFSAIEEVFRHYDGRPHWGKMHTLVASDFKNIYPKYDEFLHHREQLDPNNILLNSYLENLLLRF